MIFVIVNQNDTIQGIGMGDELPAKAKEISTEQAVNIKVGEPLCCYDANWQRIPDAELIASGKISDRRGYWHDPQTPFWEDRGENHSKTYHAPTEMEITHYNENPPAGWAKGRHPELVRADKKKSRKQQAITAKANIENFAAKKVLETGATPPAVEKARAAITLQAVDGLTLKERLELS